MSGDTPITMLRVSQCCLPMCDRCESSRGLWDSDGDRLDYCGNCGARIDWALVVDADADDEVRAPRDGELDPPDEPSSPRGAYQAARNCDRFANADEAVGAYRQGHKYMVVSVFLDWLFAKAEGDDHANA